jgi:hypothetical protein
MAAPGPAMRISKIEGVFGKCFEKIGSKLVVLDHERVVKAIKGISGSMTR